MSDSVLFRAWRLLADGEQELYDEATFEAMPLDGLTARDVANRYAEVVEARAARDGIDVACEIKGEKLV